MAVPASAMPNMPHLFAKHEVATYGGDVAHVSHPYRNSSRGYSGDAAACYGASTLSLFVGHLHCSSPSSLASSVSTTLTPIPLNMARKRDSLQSQNSAGFRQIHATFQTDNLRRHF